MTLTRRRFYSNFHNQLDDDKIRGVQIGEEWALDYLALVMGKGLPSLIDDIYQRNRAAHLPPRGIRGFSITGAATRNYVAAVHEEPMTDPLWTLCLCVYRSPALANEQDHAFGWPGLHGGRGLLMKPTRRFAWAWKGAASPHGGIFGKHTAEGLKNKQDPTYEHLTIAMYQKQGPLNYGHRYLSGPPAEPTVRITELDKQHEKYSMSWMM